MGEFDPAPGAPIQAPADDFAPAPGAPVQAPSAPAPQPYQGTLSRIAHKVAQPFVDIGHGLVKADRAIGEAIVHPIDTFNAIRATPGAHVREFMRGVNDNIPFANRGVEAMGGPAAMSPEDEAAAPGARPIGGVVGGVPAGEALGGLASKAVETAAPVVARAVKSIGEGSEARNIARTKEALELKVNRGTRGRLRTDAVDNTIAESPELQAAAGDDAKLSEATANIKKKAGETLDQIYTESPAARTSAAGELKGLQAKAVEARARANDLRAKASPELSLTDEARKIDAPQGAEPSLFDLARKVDAPVSDATAREMGRAGFEEQQAARAEASKAASAAADQAEAEAGKLEKQVAAKQREASPPVDTSRPVAAMNDRISALKKGTSSDRAVAKELESIRDEFQSTVGKRGKLSPQELRAEQSDYQAKGYGKSLPGDHAGTARIEANREASKAVGDAVVEHVTGMPYEAAKAAAAADPNSLAARLFKANDQVSAANKIEAGIADRASRVQPKHGLAKVAQEIRHNPTGYALSRVPAVASAAAKKVDSVISRVAPRASSVLGKLGANSGAAGTPLAQVRAAAAAGNTRAQALLERIGAAPVRQRAAAVLNAGRVATGAGGIPVPVGTATSGTLATQ